MTRYKAFVSDWHVLANSVRCEDEFERRWTTLLHTYEPAREYLTKYVYPNREKWCCVWRRTYTTLGAASTQRIESTFRAIKYFREANSTLETLFSVILEITESWVRERSRRITSSQHTNHSVSGSVYTAAVQHLTREAAERVFSESPARVGLRRCAIRETAGRMLCVRLRAELHPCQLRPSCIFFWYIHSPNLVA